MRGVFCEPSQRRESNSDLRLPFEMMCLLARGFTNPPRGHKRPHKRIALIRTSPKRQGCEDLMTSGGLLQSDKSHKCKNEMGNSDLFRT